MNLSVFINHLVHDGQVTVVDQLIPFTPTELAHAQEALLAYYQEDKLEMPGQAPDFDAAAALWAAGYVYHAAQLTVIREAGIAAIDHWLPPYEAPLTSGSIYSADLCLRYLPDLLSLSKGLPPDDPLVTRLKTTAMQWPFSSTGMNLSATGNTDLIIACPSLLQMYADRIIATRDAGRCNIAAVEATVNASLGNYASILWPEYKPGIDK